MGDRKSVVAGTVVSKATVRYKDGTEAFEIILDVESFCGAPTNGKLTIKDAEGIEWLDDVSPGDRVEVEQRLTIRKVDDVDPSEELG